MCQIARDFNYYRQGNVLTVAIKAKMAVLTIVTVIFLIINITEASDLDQCSGPMENVTCKWENLCEDSSYSQCKCDNICDLYNDCCPGYKPTFSLNGKYNPNVTSCKEDFKISMMGKFYIIDKCPEYFPDYNQRKLCEEKAALDSMLQRLPVSDKNGFMFKNAYCAMCNGIDYYDVVNWLATVSCLAAIEVNNITALQKSLKEKTCSVTFKEPSRKYRARQCLDIIDSCPPEFEDDCIRYNCENSTYRRPVFGFYAVIFKNEHCAKCNIDIVPKLVPKFSCHASLGLAPYYPMSIIIDLNTAGGGKVGYKSYGRPINETKTKACESGFMMDILQNECVLVSCAPGLTQVGDRCVTASQEIKDCLRKSLSPDEYKMQEDGAVTDTFGNSYNESQYEDIGNGTLSVCINLPKTGGIQYVHKFDNAQTIFSIVGQCISIICLTILLIVYSILPQLRNPPGKALMALAASLLAAQVFFLFGVGRTDPHELCVTIGILIHYSFLASFFWMAVMSFDIWATFSESNAASSFAHRSNKFLKYCVTGFGGPLLIVIIAIMLNFIEGTPEHIKPAYGDGWCWIVNRTSLIIFFRVPVFSIVFFNILFYCLTLQALYLTSKVTKQVRKDGSERQRFALYVKLSTIMGLTWLFGLVAVLADIDALWYVFLFFNTLQGAFICIAFIFTKRVISLMRDKFKKAWPRQSESADSEGTKSTDLSKRHTSSSTPPPVTAISMTPLNIN